MKRLLPAYIATACLIVGIALIPPGLNGCNSVSGAPSDLVIFLTGDSRGYLEPCGCRRDQAGGLPGRATIIADKKAANKLVLDVGNLTPGVRPYELMKFRYLLQGMAKIGYDAVNIGKTDVDLDRDTLLNAIQQSGLPFVSANVVDKSSQKPLTESYRIVTRGGLKIGITGVTGSESRSAGPGIEVRPAMEALADVIPALKKQCDYLIVLAFVDEDALREIASKFHEVNAVLGGDVPQSSSSAQEINRAFIFSVMDRGKILGEVDLKRNGDVYKVDNVQGIKILRDKITPHRDMVTLISHYKDELREKRFELASAEGMERIGSPSGTADQFVGDAACASCHVDSHKTATAAAHNNAYKTLVSKKSEYDPECLKCHTVGYGLNSGFVDAVRTPNLTNVQCESCHGRGKEHIRAMVEVLQKPTLAEAMAVAHKPTTLKSVTQATCITCHDKENSENFVYDTFWPKIAHGKAWPDYKQFWNERASLIAKSPELGKVLK